MSIKKKKKGLVLTETYCLNDTLPVRPLYYLTILYPKGADLCALTAFTILYLSLKGLPDV